MQYCPIVQQYNCRHDCLFLRNGGCSLVLAATISDGNRLKIENLEQKIDRVVYNQGIINSNLEKIARKQ